MSANLAIAHQVGPPRGDTKKSPAPTDKFVGARVRMRRLMLDMSQEKLGDAIGLTFQQVQKYEKGANRIGASRLQQIAHILQVPVGFFFDGAPGVIGEGQTLASSPSVVPAHVTFFLATSNGLELSKHFMRLGPETQRTIVAMVKQIADDHA